MNERATRGKTEPWLWARLREREQLIRRLRSEIVRLRLSRDLWRERARGTAKRR